MSTLPASVKVLSKARSRFSDKLEVCDRRKNALLKDRNQSDRIDARKLAELLRGNQVKPVYHGEAGVRMLRELISERLRGQLRNDQTSC